MILSINSLKKIKNLKPNYKKLFINNNNISLLTNIII